MISKWFIYINNMYGVNFFIEIIYKIYVGIYFFEFRVIVYLVLLWIEIIQINRWICEVLDDCDKLVWKKLL